ncbi:MAG: DUF4215 domain-containing protein [Myxococcales bacterium]|nr:DUF4215 domain-containing protein [Myxococcales bacterium]
MRGAATFRIALAPLFVVALLGSCADEAPSCGDGAREGGEACDDGNTTDDDGCTNACTRPRCGDGIAQASFGEQCDDGNAWDDDGCTTQCRLPRCGDGALQKASGEACDDGNLTPGDACTHECRVAVCGDGVLRLGLEACDDGNTEDGDRCSATCQLSQCGNGVVEGAEACDDGNASATDSCLPSCVLPSCGDGYHQIGVEECDDGNADDHDGCLHTCLSARCGDGVHHVGVEACDGGPGCTPECRWATCGDGDLQPPEQCDDGNPIATDGCRPDCLSARCGDGLVQVGAEECDDGNANDHDACTGACKHARCGDGIVRPAVEACDDGNQADDDACRNVCALPSCGDGVVQPGEDCDDGNASNADACLTSCVAASCGDGVVLAGVEACDDGNVSNFDACLNSCKPASCGDGVRYVGVESCDDGNEDDLDDCSNACVAASCGDGQVQPGEECDDGNASETDACRNACVLSRCGDGVVRAGVEACDDGNTVDGDDCSNVCAATGCGDGIASGLEACDDGNASDGDLCLSTCMNARCGDGVVAVGHEDCDDGNDKDRDACLSSCVAARCGDGQRHVGIEACDDGNAFDGDACLSDCTAARCGDGVVRLGDEQCDDQNSDNTDGCLLTCATFDWCQGFTISSVSPPVACVGAAPSTLRLSSGGRGFLFVEGKAPVVTFAGLPVAIQNKLGCSPIAGGFVSAEGCAQLDVAIPNVGLPIGDYEITAKNPITVACSDRAIFSVGPTPNIVSVVPSEACEDLGFTVTIFGTGLVGSTQVTLVGPSGQVVSSVSTELLAPGQLRATFDGLVEGKWAVRVSNGPGCEDQLDDAIDVFPRPVVFFVDPPVIYNGVDVQASVYVANVNGGSVAEVAIRRVGTSTWIPIPHVYDPLRPFRVQTTVPRDLIAAGERVDFEFSLTDGLGCPASLSGVAALTKIVSVSPFVMAPPFGGQSSSTGVTIEIPDGSAGVPFQEIPRVYLNPIGDTGVATPLSSLGFLSGRSLTGLVPGGLPPGDYQVIVVNPDGTVGISSPPIPEGGFRITTAPPPQIRTIAPGSIPTPDTVVKVFGSGFVAPTVRLECDVPGVATPQLFGATNVALQSYGLDFTMDSADAPPQDSVCVVRVTSSDGSFAEFSALVLLNSAENIPDSTDTQKPMQVARRAPAIEVGSVSTTSRFLYAMGGDNGAVATALSSIEVMPLTPFGNLEGAWRTLSVPIPGAVTAAQSASLGRFIYLVGGESGSGPTASVLRAEVLQPTDTPEFDGNLEIALSGSGLGPGLWYYQVSAVMAATDADNPGGETLPSEPLPIVVPAWAPSGFLVTLRWSAVPGAASYRLYRSQVADGALSSVRRITELPAGTTSFSDPTTPAAPAAAPRQLGDLGTWRVLPNMTAPRAGFGLAVARDPGNLNRHYLYAVGGRSTGGTPVGTWESLQLDTTGDGSQAVAASWVSGGANTVPARHDHGVWAVDVGVVSPPGVGNDDDAWIFIGPGTGAANATRIYSAQVKAGGALGTFALAFNGNASRSGYGAVAISSQLFLLGGRVSGAISSSRDSSLITGPGTISNVNATPGDLSVAREFPGTALGSGRIFLVGGQTPSGPTSSVESSPW